MNPNFTSQLEQVHVQAWNEKDATKRNSLLKEIYADDIRMYDREFILDGLPAVSDFIGKLLAEDAAFRFESARPIETLQNGARLFGKITTSGGILNSMDFFIIENEKVKHLYAFMEAS